jgi:hypothetical protein
MGVERITNQAPDDGSPAKQCVPNHDDPEGVQMSGNPGLMAAGDCRKRMQQSELPKHFTKEASV